MGRNKQHPRAVAVQQVEEPLSRTLSVVEGGEIMRSEVVSVTPELAKRWLGKNHPGNRPVAWSRVASFANDMRDGNWKLTHQAIGFDGSDMLIDGQHRLEAVVQSGVTVQMLVVRNRVGDFHDPIDRGAPRSLALLMGT